MYLTMRISLELKDLLSFVAKLRQDTLQFTLLEALLRACLLYTSPSPRD